MNRYDGLFSTSTPVPILDVIIILDFLLIVFIMIKMCQLFSKAFSYSNFHIHETYKLYTLGIISLFLVIATRFCQIDLSNSPKLMDNHGYCIWVEIVGQMSIYSMNEMYLLNGFTWLMIALNCDFTQRRNIKSYDEEEDIEKLIRKRKIIFRTKVVTLYFIFPAFMLGSISLILYSKNLDKSDGRVILSRIMVNFSSLITGIMVSYPLIKLLCIRWNDVITEKKVKAMWGFIAFTVIFRVVYFQIQTIFAFLDKQFSDIEKIVMPIQSVVIGIMPIIILSYLSEKQLERERLQSKIFGIFLVLKSPAEIFFNSSIL